MATLTISRFLDDDLATGEAERILGARFCEDEHVAIVLMADGKIWHYLSDPWTTGEVCHQQELCGHIWKN